jgi:uncharacterized membrane protein YedE/YeeE
MNAPITKRPNLKAYAAFTLVLLIASVVAAAATRLWVLTAIPIGFLFGFFLQKGDLCGSSAFSEILLFKSGRKVFGLWILVVVAMAGFAALDLLHVVTLVPKPFLYLNYIIGGLFFGTGMVLAGGCISGCLYKSTMGNLNSIVALLTIPMGVMVVEHGPLNSFFTTMSKAKLSMADSKAIALDRVLGIPFWVAAAIAVAATLIGIFYFKKRKPQATIRESGSLTFEGALTRSWSPWVAGLAIGLLMIPAYLSSVASGRNYPLGITHGVMQAELLLIDRNLDHAYGQTVAPAPQSSSGQATPPAPPVNKDKKVVWWLVALVVGLVAGSFVSAKISGQTKLLPKPPDEMLFAMLGGLLVGIGAAFAGGCIVGNIMSGWALLSVGMFLFGIVTILSNWAMTKIYLIGINNNK